MTIARHVIYFSEQSVSFCFLYAPHLLLQVSSEEPYCVLKSPDNSQYSLAYLLTDECTS